MNDYLLLGTFVKPQGLKGEAKLRHETGDASRFLSLRHALLRQKEGFAPVRVLKARLSGEDVYLTLEGFSTREQAEALRGAELYVNRENARPLDDGEVFLADLIGIKAVDTRGNEIGTLSDVLQMSGADVLVFRTPAGRMMAPHLKRLVKEVSGGRMVLDEAVLPEASVYDENRRADDLS